MRKILTLSICLSFSVSALAKIVVSDKKLYIESNGNPRQSIMMVNKLADEGRISKVKLYREGKINMLSFAKKGEKEKLYSVDSKGFIYSIEPFASYSVKSVDDNGRIIFKEAPSRKYTINSKGFFLY